MTESPEMLAADPGVMRDLERMRGDNAPTKKHKRSLACQRSAFTRWKNPEYRKKMSAVRTGRKFPKLSASIKENWSIPELREKMLAGLREEEPRKRISDAAKRRWANPKWRRKIMRAQRKARLKSE